MRIRPIRMWIVAAVVAVSVLAVAAPAFAGTRLIPSGATTQIRASSTGPDVLQQPELRPDGGRAEEGGSVADRPRPGEKKGKGIFPKKPLKAPKVKSSAVALPGAELSLSIPGLNHRQQRLANGGNQFSLEPPDQALCVGNGFTVESVNSVLRVFSSATGAALTGVQDLNTFFGYPMAINRGVPPGTPNQIGPNVIDPVCLYDPENNRFVVAITTLHVDANGDFNGKNTIDVAVSNSGDPTGAWTVYYVPAQNDGTDGTPNHGCTLDGTAPGPCFQDYPHIGQDANGVYITTNEYDLFGPSYNAAQVFAFSKTQLKNAPASIPVTLVENLSLEGTPGFTVWPAISNAGDYATDQGGTEYFLSTIAGDGSETGNPTGTASRIGLWALTNTASLNSFTPSVEMTSRLVNSQDYVYPPVADQKPGSIPLGDCLNDNAGSFFGDDCWFALFFDPPATWQPEVESSPDAADTRMQQVWYANGLLWGANGTAADVGKDIKAGIAWYAVEPKLEGNGNGNGKGKGKGKDKLKLNGTVRKQGYLALEDNNLTYPAIAMGANGKGALAFSVMGKDYFPSAGYALIDSKGNVGPVQIAAAGLGPADGFTSYKAFVGDPPGTRWGDYGAAVTDGNSIWIASEYIAQTCTLTDYLSGAIGSCGGTRTSLGNWATRVSKLTP